MSAVLMEGAPVTPVDPEEMRKKHSGGARECEYAECASPVPTCHDASADVLALCDEVEALRAKVVAAPEVLREWPAKVEDALGEWFLCLHGARAPRGEFEANGNRKPLFRDEEGDIWPAHEFEPGEFFVRCP